jgi:hypothetical protein
MEHQFEQGQDRATASGLDGIGGVHRLCADVSARRPVDLSCYYTGNAGNMGCFEPDGRCRKKACALKTTGAMLATPVRLKVIGANTQGFAVLAGRSPDQKTVQVLISSYRIQQPQEPPRQSAPPGSHGLERRKLRPANPQGYSLKVSRLPWGDKPYAVKRYRIDEQQDFALVQEMATKGATLEVRQPLAPPAIELIVLTRE